MRGSIACLALFAFLPVNAQKPPQYKGVVPEVEQDVQPLIALVKPEIREAAMKEVLSGNTFADQYKLPFVLPVRRAGSENPWKGMALAERSSLTVAALAGTSADYVLESMLKAIDKPYEPTPLGSAAGPRPILDANSPMRLVASVTNLNREALDRLTQDEAAFVVTHARGMGDRFFCQETPSETVNPLLIEDKKFCDLAWNKIDWSKLARIVSELTTFARQSQEIAKSFSRSANTPSVPGVEGELRFARKLEQGWVLVGGPGKNVYATKEPVALILELGGDDTYSGNVGSALGTTSAVFDLSGNDQYSGTIASGTGGVGFVYDLHGNDRYECGNNSGGVGIGGFGVLWDGSGDDVYTGSRMTLGSAMAGLGLLLDQRGKDQYRADIFGIGLAAPASVAAVLDGQGDDTYRLGFKVPSGYNGSDAPDGPSNPNFQYEGFGMGMGCGRRVYPGGWEANQIYGMAGGLGMLLDVSGRDEYESSNFSQGCGYFQGVGVKLDLDGHDTHKAARYGHASGAHFAMGLFVDYRGNDQYGSTGPTYNSGCAWDRNPFLFVDAQGNDVYDYMKSDGLGRGDIGGWGVFSDLGGDDDYRLRGRPGKASRNGIGVFFDRAGKDKYANPEAANARRAVDADGGVFEDKG